MATVSEGCGFEEISGLSGRELKKRDDKEKVGVSGSEVEGTQLGADQGGQN